MPTLSLTFDLQDLVMCCNLSPAVFFLFFFDRIEESWADVLNINY